jgi:hypothetical protein
MYRPRIEALENRQLFAVAAPGVDREPDIDIEVGGRVLTLSPEQGAVLIRWLVQHPGHVVEDGADESAAHGPIGPLSYQLQLEEVLVNSYRGLTQVANAAHGGILPAAFDLVMAELGSHQADGIAMTEYLIILSARQAADAISQRVAATDLVTAEQGDDQADPILHEDNEFSFPRMITFGGTLPGESRSSFHWGETNAVRVGRAEAANGWYYLLPNGEL